MSKVERLNGILAGLGVASDTVAVFLGAGGYVVCMSLTDSAAMMLIMLRDELAVGDTYTVQVLDGRTIVTDRVTAFADGAVLV